MSVLTFFGRGSAFTDEQNAAFFWHGNDLIIIDCPTVAFQKAKKAIKGINWTIYNIYVVCIGFIKTNRLIITNNNMGTDLFRYLNT